MRLTPQQIESFRTEGWLFLPELFTPEEVELLRREAISIYDEQRPKSGAKKAAHRARPLPPISTTRHFVCSARTRV